MKTSTLLRAMLLPVLLVAACSKDDDPAAETDEYYFRFKVDGVAVEYPFSPNNLTATFNAYAENEELYVVQVAGRRQLAEADKNQFSIHLSHSGELQTGVRYAVEEASGQTVPDVVMTVGYWDGEGTMYIASVIGNGLTRFGNALVTFTEVTDNYVKGTFSASLQHIDSSGGTTEVLGTAEITGGEFMVPRF